MFCCCIHSCIHIINEALCAALLTHSWRVRVGVNPPRKLSANINFQILGISF